MHLEEKTEEEPLSLLSKAAIGIGSVGLAVLLAVLGRSKSARKIGDIIPPSKGGRGGGIIPSLDDSGPQGSLGIDKNLEELSGKISNTIQQDENILQESSKIIGNVSDSRNNIIEEAEKVIGQTVPRMNKELLETFDDAVGEAMEGRPTTVKKDIIEMLRKEEGFNEVIEELRGGYGVLIHETDNGYVFKRITDDPMPNIEKSQSVPDEATEILSDKDKRHLLVVARQALDKFSEFKSFHGKLLISTKEGLEVLKKHLYKNGDDMLDRWGDVITRGPVFKKALKDAVDEFALTYEAVNATTVRKRTNSNKHKPVIEDSGNKFSNNYNERTRAMSKKTQGEYEDEINKLAMKQVELETSVDDLLTRRDIGKIELVITDNIKTKEGTAGAAQIDTKNKKIFLDRAFLKKKFEEKAWTNPRELKKILDDGSIRTSKATPLPENTFKTYDEFERFVVAHEVARLDLPRKVFETMKPRSELTYISDLAGDQTKNLSTRRLLIDKFISNLGFEETNELYNHIKKELLPKAYKDSLSILSQEERKKAIELAKAKEYEELSSFWENKITMTPYGSRNHSVYARYKELLKVLKDLKSIFDF